MNTEERTIIRRTTGAAMRLVSEFAELPVEQSLVEDWLVKILFREKELYLIHEAGLVTDKEFVDAVAANLVSLALEFRTQPAPADQSGTESAIDDLRVALIP